jgi:tellurite resistance protein TerC
MDTEHGDPAANPVLKLVRRFFPVTEQYHGQHFFVRAGSSWALEAAIPGEPPKRDRVVETAKSGAFLLTPLALALVMVETTDLIFAVDSIPAIFAITGDPFIVFTSNVFAILGLRSLYFALAGMMDKFRYLKFSLAIVLTAVGIKMLTATWLKGIFGANFNFYLLGLIFLILGVGVAASIFANWRDQRRQTPPVAHPPGFAPDAASSGDGRGSAVDRIGEVADEENHAVDAPDHARPRQ